MSATYFLIGIMSLAILINTYTLQKESFVNSNNEKKPEDDVLDKVNSMNEKLDDLVDKEKETRTFCKLLRHDNSNQEQMTKLMEHRNKQFEDSWKKQNKMLSQIKKKIIEIKTSKNDKEFMKFNTGRNKKRLEYEKRKKLLEVAKKMIKRPPAVNLTFQNNI